MWISIPAGLASRETPFRDRAAADELLPPAALAGAQDDLGDLVAFGVLDQGAGDVVCVNVVPAGAHVCRRLLQPGERAVCAATSAILAGDADDLETRQFPEGGGEVVGTEEICEGQRSLPGRIDLALQQPLAQMTLAVEKR
jgi:hypothetical protein